jgi:proteasome accessory factor B
MGRNDGVIRQWALLRQLATSRTHTIATLAADLGVTTRTIRRDLAALQAAGFPLYDEAVDGRTFWRMDAKAFGTLARNGLTFSELCALYFSRALLECFAGTHLLADLESALDKFDAALTPQMKKFLDQLPRAIKVKPGGAKRAGTETYKTTSRLLEAIMAHQVMSMRYHSQASRRDKDYIVHPYRLVYAQGGLYLMAFVPAYSELRTFAVERIAHLGPHKETFTPVPELDADPFQHSLGVHRGPTTKVQLQFDPRIAETVKERSWHPSQQFKDRSDGSVVMTLDVCDDYALRSWILGFGRYVRVLTPATLVAWVQDEVEGTLAQYPSRGTPRPTENDGQPALPFLFNRLASA